jgi:hypothetical protein
MSPSWEQEGQRFGCAGRQHFHVLRANDTVHDKRIGIDTLFQRRSRAGMGQDHAAGRWLETTGKYENAVIEAMLEPGFVAFHVLAGQVPVGRKFQ